MPYKDREEQLKYFRRYNRARREEQSERSHRRWLKNHPEPTIIEHHIKYKEIHGIDETVFITAGEHKRLHNRLREEGKCNIPVDVLTRITNKAQYRTEKRKKYLQSPEMKEKRAVYHKQSITGLYFTRTIGINTRLIETIQYNKITGTVTINSFFRIDHERDIVELRE